MQFMSEYYLDLRKTRQDFLSQITLPVIQLIAAIFIVCILIFVNGFLQAGSPTDEPFDLTGVGLRGGTGVLIFLTIVLGVGIVVGIIAFGIWKNWFNCHNTLVPLIRNVPVIGPVFTQSAMARLSMTLSMMLGAGVDAKRSVRDGLLSTGNYYYMSGLPLTMQEIERGNSLADSLAAPGVLPGDFIQAVEIGELSGSDSESLERMAVVYREKAQLALKQLAIAAGFVIWFLIAAMVIAVIFTIFMQVINMYSGFLPK
jgi:type II secretory pathway component PulF